MADVEINSDAFIKSALVQNTITSYCIIVVPKLSSVFEDGWDEIAEEPEFEKLVSYLRYDLDYDNMTGDINKNTYTEVSIYAEVQPLEITDKAVKAGEMREGDANIFLPARILVDSSGASISPSFRPQINDEIVFRGIVYRIEKMVFERIGAQEIFADCMCKRMENEFPDQRWNDSYCDKYEQPGKSGKGWT